MRNRSRLALLGAAVAGVCVGTAARASGPEQFLSGNDFAVAIDAIPNYYIDSNPGTTTFSMYPNAEPPQGMIDGSTASKYLNFGARGSGFVAVPGGSSILQSFQISTANDAVERDPTSYVLLGTNSPVVSTDRGNGLGGETWTLISQGSLSLPDTRTTAGPVVNLTNSTAYSAYKLYFPSVKNPVAANSMQISECQFFTGADGGGTALFNPNTDVRAIDNPTTESGHNTTEAAVFCLDQNPNTKYLNLMNGAAGNDTNHGAGLVFTPKRGPSVVQSFQITTANDSVTRDPIGYTIYGTNDPLGAANQVDNGNGNGGENWTPIATGTLSLPATRLTPGGVIPITNSTSYTSYKVVFDGTKGSSNMQIGDLSFIGNLTGATEWTTNASGSWLNGQNWFGPTPNGVDDTARFLNKSTSAHTVVADAPVTVGTLRMENNATYLLTGAGNLTMQVSTGAASINVSGATHEINLPLTIASNTTVNVAAGATLKISDPVVINAGKTVTQTGAGTVVYESTVNIAGGAGFALQSVPQMNSLSLADNAGATLSFAGGRQAMHLQSLSVHPNATVDVKTNGMVIGGAAQAGSVTQIGSLIASGFAGGTWTGKGITSSTAAADASSAHKTGVGYGEASVLGLTSFMGQSVESGAVVVRHTYIGDANLDGAVDTLDFNSLAANFGQTGKVWTQSDFNYDGVVDTLDFNGLASNFGQQIQASDGVGGLVPEPGTMGLLAGAGALLLARRRRGRD